MAVRHEIPDQLHMDGSTVEQKLYDEAIYWLKFMNPRNDSPDVPPYYLATSFGKDSIVAQRLCDEAGVPYEAHHNHTTVDPPELVYFGRKHYPDAIRHYPARNMFQIIVDKGIMPLRQMRFCCDKLKEDGGEGRRCVMGIRAAESSRRAKTWGLATERSRRSEYVNRIFDPDDVANLLSRCSLKSLVVISPMIHWPDSVLWNFIRDRKMPYCELYDQGYTRLGCIMCPMASEHQRRAEGERWPGFYRLYLKAAQKLIDNGRFANLGSAEAIMDWWLSERTQSKDITNENQISLIYNECED